MRKRTKTVIVAAVAALGIATAGISWAYFTETATANATGGNGANMVALTVGTPAYTFDDAATALYPGHFANVVVAVTNPNEVPVTITSVVPAAVGAKDVTGGTTPNNSATRTLCEGKLNLAPTPATTGNGTGAGGLTIAAGGSITIALDDAVGLDASAGNECQGMVFSTKWDLVTQNN